MSFQIFTVPSDAPVAKRFDSGSVAIRVIALECSETVVRHSKSNGWCRRARHIRKELSAEPLNKMDTSEECVEKNFTALTAFV
jgi:hypothetical protein